MGFNSGFKGLIRPITDIDIANIILSESCNNLKFGRPCSEHPVYSWFQTFAVFWMLYVFFWIIPQLMNFICRRFGTLCMFHLHRQVDVLAYEDGTESSETSAYKIHTPGNYPEENIQHTEQGKILKSRNRCLLYVSFWVIPRRLNFICRRFGTLCLFHLHRQVGK